MTEQNFMSKVNVKNISILSYTNTTLDTDVFRVILFIIISFVNKNILPFPNHYVLFLPKNSEMLKKSPQNLLNQMQYSFFLPRKCILNASMGARLLFFGTAAISRIPQLYTLPKKKKNILKSFIYTKKKQI